MIKSIYNSNKWTTNTIKHVEKIILSVLMVFCISLYAIEPDNDCRCCYHLIPEGAVLANGRNANVNARFSIEELRERQRTGDSIYQHLRVRCQKRGIVTYAVPVQDSEIEFVIERIASRESRNQAINSQFPVTRIRNSGLFPPRKYNDYNYGRCCFNKKITCNQINYWRI